MTPRARPAGAVLHSRPHGILLNSVAAGGLNGVRVGRGPHLEPGVVEYDMSDGSKYRYLLTPGAIEKGRPTAASRPILGRCSNFEHVEGMDPKQKVDLSKYDGGAVESFHKDGKEWLLFQINDQLTAEAAENGYQFSSAYLPTDVEEKPGRHHNVAYDAIIHDLAYTHFAVVQDPRYDFAKDGARIEILNSKTKGASPMNKMLRAALALFPIKDVREVFNAMEADDKKSWDDKKGAAKAEAKNKFDEAMKSAGDDEGKKKEAQNAYEAANAAADKMGPEPEETPEQKARKEKENRLTQLKNEMDALEKDLGAKPSPGGGDVPPEPGVPAAIQAGGLGTEQPPKVAPADATKTAGAAAAAVENETAPPETPEQKAAREKSDLEKKNAADAEAKKKAADDEAAKTKKEHDEKQNALKLKAKAEAEAKAEALKTERFNSLKALVETSGGAGGSPMLDLVMTQEKADLGKARYGSR